MKLFELRCFLGLNLLETDSFTAHFENVEKSHFCDEFSDIVRIMNDVLA